MERVTLRPRFIVSSTSAAESTAEISLVSSVSFLSGRGCSLPIARSGRTRVRYWTTDRTSFNNRASIYTLASTVSRSIADDRPLNFSIVINRALTLAFVREYTIMGEEFMNSPVKQNSMRIQVHGETSR